MIIDVIKSEHDVMYIRCDDICVPNVTTYTLVVMSLTERCRCVCHLCDDTDTVTVMSNMVGEMSGIGVVLS